MEIASFYDNRIYKENSIKVAENIVIKIRQTHLTSTSLISSFFENYNIGQYIILNNKETQQMKLIISYLKLVNRFTKYKL